MSDKPNFREGDVVMVCRHVFESARRGNPPDLASLHWDKPEGPRRFYRGDLTTGLYNFLAKCDACVSADPHSVVYVEEIFLGGLLHVADFLGGTKPS